MSEEEISNVQLSERLGLFICLWGLFSFARSSVSPVEQIGLYWAQAVELVLDRCVAYAPQGEMVLKKGCVSEREREKGRKGVQMVELLNVQTSLGSGGGHTVDSLLVITAVTFLTATFHALVGGWCTIALCVTSYLQWRCRSRGGWSKSHAMVRRFSLLNL